MARIHGRKGTLYVGLASGTAAASPVAYLTDWALNFTTDRVEITALGDNNKTYVAGLPDAQGTFSGFYDDASAQTYTAAVDGVARNFYLYPTSASAGTYWYGTGLFDFNVTGSVTDAVKISGSFAAASAVTKVSS